MSDTTKKPATSNKDSAPDTGKNEGAVQQAVNAGAANPDNPANSGKSGDKVVVGCKLPHGLILEHSVRHEDKGPDGHVTGVRYIGTGHKLILNGYNTSSLVGGYGLTHNVSRDFIERWLDDNKDFGPVREGLIFIAKDEKDAKSIAEERVGTVTGFEANNPVQPGPKLEPASTPNA